jgi:hypothetical protein
MIVIVILLILLIIYYCNTIESFNSISEIPTFLNVETTMEESNNQYDDIISPTKHPLYLSNDNKLLSRIADKHYLEDQRKFYQYQMTMIL